MGRGGASWVGEGCRSKGGVAWVSEGLHEQCRGCKGKVGAARD